jgi:chorismate dehydratase
VDFHYKISMIPFANMGPFRKLGTPRGATWVFWPPRQSSDKLLTGEIVAAAAPVGDFARLSSVCEFVGEYGIAARTQVGSVLFFSRKSFSEINSSHRIRLSGLSSSSVRLLYLLLGYRNGFDNLPSLAGDDEDFDGELVIGDAALKRLLNGPDELFVTDLVTEWDRVHNLPFVFARWVVRKDAPTEVRREIESWLAPLEQKDRAYVYASAGEEALRLGISESAMVEYLFGMKRVLGPEELAGQERFVEEYKKFGREPVFLKSK